MRAINCSSRKSLVALSVLALGVGVVAGCKVSGQGLTPGSSNPMSSGGQVCASGSGQLSGSNGDVQLHLCTDWTCQQGESESGACVTCTASQPSGTPIPPGVYSCASQQGGLYCPPGTGGGAAGWTCVATATELSCGPTGGCSSGGDCNPGTEGCPTGSGGGSGSDCNPGTEGCPSSGSGGSGGGCIPGTEGCPSGGSGGSSGGCIPGTEGCPSGSGGSGGSGGPCTFTQGYWKNHPNAWPVISVKLGNVIYSQAQLLQIFNTPAAGNGLISLAHQLCAVKLNIAAGAVAPPVTLAAVSAADAMIGNLVIPPIGAGFLSPATTSNLNDILESFNALEGTGTIQCGHTVATHVHTWGDLKSLYR